MAPTKKEQYHTYYSKPLVDSEGWTHGALDVQRANVLPVLLQQGNQEVGSHHDLVDNNVLLHLNVTNSNGKTKNLLQLELDGGLDVVDLGVKVVVVGNRSWELTGLGQLRTKQSWNLLDQHLRSNESIVLLGQLLDQLLVLVQLLQVLNAHGVNSKRLGSVNVEGVSEDAHSHVWTWNLWQLQGTRETLVSLRVVVLQTNLELNGLQEVSLLGLIGVGQDLLDVLTNLGGSDFRHVYQYLVGLAVFRR